LRVLRTVALVAAEDTRRSGKLLAHYGISTPTVSYHAHNSRLRLPQLIERLSSGQSIALVTDAGTPGVSDPGVELVEACLQRGISVDPVPGVSAPLAAAVASGFPLLPFTVFGFPPHRAKDRIAWLESAGRVTHTFSFFEAPHRIEGTLEAAAIILGDRPMMVARELTKAHQEFVSGTATTLATHSFIVKGEFTVVVGPAVRTDTPAEALNDAELLAEFGRMTEEPDMNRRMIVTVLAKRSGRSARDVYATVERAKARSRER
jgi:16S rRNA (cytidine1402-2'-O)-methyltransferase